MCRISIPYSGNPDALIVQIRDAIAKAGGVFSAAQRNFVIPTPVGKVAGNYFLETNAIWISITEKPFLVRCGQIEEEMKKYVAAIPKGPATPPPSV